MDTTAIKQEIDTNITTNGSGAITGAVMNATLNDIVDAVAPAYYSEDTDDGDATINPPANLNLIGTDKSILKTAGWIVKVEEGTGIMIGNSDETYCIEIANDYIEIHFDDSVLKMSSATGLQYDGVRIATEGDLPNIYSRLGFEFFFSSRTYNIGDLVVRDNNLYRFIAAHHGSWDANDVEQTDLKTILNL